MSTIIRRDRRSEWIARNRLHPLHHTLQITPDRWMGPNGVARKNPHAALGFIGPNGIRRIDRSGASAPGSVGKPVAMPDVMQLPLHRVEEPAFYIAFVPDMPGERLSSHDRDVLGLAHRLAGKEGAVLAVVFGQHKETALDTAGVDRLLHLSADEYQAYAPEQRILALHAVERQFKPRYWLLPDSHNGGGELGRRLAARLGERPATRVWQIDGEHCTARAGNGQQDIHRPLARVILALAECHEPVSDTRHEVRALKLDTPLAQSLPRIRDLGAALVDPSQVPMAEAEFILSGGNGVQDWALFHRAAEVLGATEGASRVAVDDGHMPRHRQVGATGTWVTARVYLAVGISGAIQHLQGIDACEKVVAVNMDPGCDMVKRADLSVIGDSSAVLQALVQQVSTWRTSQPRAAA